LDQQPDEPGDNGKTKRLFVAGFLPIEAQNRFKQWMADQKTKLPWQDTRRLHLNIIPPFYVPENNFADVQSLVTLAAYQNEKFKLTFGGPRILEDEPRGKPQFSRLWSECYKTQELIALRSYLMRLLPLPQEILDEEYEPHILLSKWKTREPAKQDIRVDEMSPLDIEIENISLVETTRNAGQTSYIYHGPFPMARTEMTVST